MDDPGIETGAEDTSPGIRESRRTGLVRLLMTFTLTLMVLGLVAIPSFHGTPNPRGQRLQVVDAIDAIWRAQVQFRRGGHVDGDGDGVGEFGTLSELAGQATLRGGDAPLSQALLGPSYAPAPGERERRHGHLFELWLPRRGGGWVSVSSDVDARDHVDPEAAERQFLLFVWPENHAARQRGGAAFYLDASGELYAHPCSETPWAGSLVAPHPSLLVRSGVPFDSGRAAPRVLRDLAGREWIWRAR